MASCGVLIVCIATLLYVGHHPSLVGAYTIGILLGVGYSAVAALTPAMMSDRFSGRHYGTIFGVGLMGSALGSAFGPWMGGALFDATGSYTLPFTIAAACGLIAMLCGGFAYRIRIRGQLI